MAKTKKKVINIFDNLRESLVEAQAYERGEEVDLRAMEIVAPPKPMTPNEIRKVRESLHASQTAFAYFLCVSPKAVQSWEQGIRRPRSTALRLLDIAKKNPKFLLATASARAK
jgi:putative transcriptional regulator